MFELVLQQSYCILSKHEFMCSVSCRSVVVGGNSVWQMGQTCTASVFVGLVEGCVDKELVANMFVSGGVITGGGVDFSVLVEVVGLVVVVGVEVFVVVTEVSVEVFVEGLGVFGVDLEVLGGGEVATFGAEANLRMAASAAACCGVRAGPDDVWVSSPPSLYPTPPWSTASTSSSTTSDGPW